MDLINLFKHFPDIIILFSDEVLFKLGHINKYFRNLIKNNNRYIEYLKNMEIIYLMETAFEFSSQKPIFLISSKYLLKDRLEYLLKDRLVKIIYKYIDTIIVLGSPTYLFKYFYIVNNKCDQKISIRNYKNNVILYSTIHKDDKCLNVCFGENLYISIGEINIWYNNQYFREMLSYYKVNNVYELFNIINNIKFEKIKIIDIVKN